MARGAGTHWSSLADVAEARVALATGVGPGGARWPHLHPPAIIKDRVIYHAKAKLEQQAASGLLRAGYRDVPERACMDAIRQVWRSENLTELERGTLQAIATRATWTRSRLHAAGYAVDPCCPLCKGAEDTMDHRLWWCSATEDLRQNLPRWLVREARAAPANSTLFTFHVLTACISRKPSCHPA